MTTVNVVTAGSGDTYRIERVYLDSDEAYDSIRPTTASRPVEPVQVEDWQVGAPAVAYDGPYRRAEWWARIPASKRRGSLRDTDEGERLDDSRFAKNGGPGKCCPRPRCCAGNRPGCPG